MTLEELLELYLQDVELSFRLNERHGVFTAQYFPYIYEIYHAILKVKPVYNGEAYVYVLQDYSPKTEDSFIDTVTVYVYVYDDKEKRGSSLTQKDFDKSNLSKELKLTDCRITVNLNGEGGKINEKDFYTVLTHELQHAYRYWAILSSCHDKEVDKSLIDKSERYADNLLRLNTKLDDKSNERVSKVERTLYSVLYYLDDDEMSSMVAELYEYIRQNEDINTRNFKEKIRQTYIFRNIINCKNAISAMDSELKSNDSALYYHIYNFLRSKYFNTEIENDKKGTMLLRQYMLKQYNKLCKKMDRTIRLALCDLNRNIKDEYITLKEFRDNGRMEEDLKFLMNGGNIFSGPID